MRVFFDACHRHGWLPRLAANATIYVEELPYHHDQIARFIPEFVMAQLESDEALGKIPHTTTRNLVVVLIETGLRGGDACNLAFNPIVDDSTGWPCLRFEATKVRAEQLIPLSAKAATAIRAQQDHVRSRWPAGSRWLFPGIVNNDDGSKPYSMSSFSRQLARWQTVINLRDQAGQPVRVSGHQFRHTLGTRLINSGVPQHVVQKLLGHASPNMTGHYAKVHDTTIREAFDRYQSHRVNIDGERVGYDPDAPTASAEWVKQNLNRVRDSLPNGYCSRPAQQDCPHPNACLTCPDFQTTPEFLDIHRQQQATNRRLMPAPTPPASSASPTTCATSKPPTAHHPCPRSTHRQPPTPTMTGADRPSSPKPTPADTTPPSPPPTTPSNASTTPGNRSASAPSPTPPASPEAGSTVKPNSATSSSASAGRHQPPPHTTSNAPAPSRCASDSTTPGPRSPAYEPTTPPSATNSPATSARDEHNPTTNTTPTGHDLPTGTPRR